MKSPRLLQAGTTTINMTPMIDVVFLLIIFFLVSSHLATQENYVALQLPDATTGIDDATDAETFVVNVMADGSWQVAGVPSDQQTLASQLQRRAAGAQEPLRLKIRTDRDVPYRSLEPILRLASAAGIGDIVFSVYESQGR